MAALIPNERCFVLASYIFLAYENGTGHIQDQGYHLQCDGATLHHEGGWPVEDELTVKEHDLAFGGAALHRGSILASHPAARG